MTNRPRDLAALPDGATPDEHDFEFRVGDDNDPGGWDEAPNPTSVTVRPGEGTDGSDRVTIVWADGVIQKQWLQVTVAANENTGLVEPDVFYYGNAIGEAGNSTQDTKVNATDMLLARNNPRTFLNPAPIDFPYDYNSDAKVNATDMLLARNNPTNFLTALKLITVPEAGAGGEEELTLPLRPTPPELAWLQGLGRTIAGGGRSENERSANEAADALLATYWE